MMTQILSSRITEVTAYLFAYQRLVLMGGISSLGLIFGTADAIAQVTPDAALPIGENTTVNLNGGTYDISGGATRGSNLFHSFDSFSLGTGEEAFFNHAPTIDTVLSRVTGGSASNIDGTIRTPINSIADLFFINPQGIVFGPNAALDIGGSFIASTATQLTFADGTTFNTANPQTTTLTISRPSGLILGEKSGSIENQSTVELFPGFPVGLEVLSGESIILVGNGLNMTGGKLTAFSGRIDIASLAPESTVSLLPANGVNQSGWMLDDETLEGLVFQDIQLSSSSRTNNLFFNSSLIDTSGDFIGNPNGTLRLWGRQILLSGSNLLNNNYGISQGGDLTIVASESLRLNDLSLISTATASDGEAGNLILDVPEGIVELSNDSQLSAQSGLFIGNGATGAAGTLTINTTNLSVKTGSVVTTGALDDAQGGTLIINAPDGFVEIVGVSQNNSGISFSRLVSAVNGTQPAGDIQIDTGALLIQDGGQIISSTFGRGKGGNTIINTTESVTVTGNVGGAPSQISSSTGEFEVSDPNLITGDAGSVNIVTGRLVVQDGGTIFTTTNGPGQGGALTVNATEIILDGNGNNLTGLFARTRGAGNSGILEVEADSLQIRDSARITVSTDDNLLPTELGTVRDATINARTITLDNGQITAESLTGDGGNLNFMVDDYILLRNNGLISATAGTAGAGGAGGNIIIDADSGIVVAIPEEDSDIRANAFEGRGGNVIITAQGVLGLERREAPTPLSDITASSESGINGTVEVNTLAFIPSPERIVLPSDVIDSSQLLAQGCDQLSAGSTSQGEFYISGRGGVSPLTSGILGSDEVIDDLRLPETWDGSSSLTEAQGWYRSDVDEIVLTAVPLPEVTRSRCRS